MAEILRALAEDEPATRNLNHLPQTVQYEVYKAVSELIIMTVELQGMETEWDANYLIRLNDGREIGYRLHLGSVNYLLDKAS